MEDFDLEEFTKMFDAALASDNPAVKKALRNFMMVTALVHSQESDDESVPGPFETLLKKIDDLERRLSRAEVNAYTYPSPYSNTWVYNGTDTNINSIKTSTSIRDRNYNKNDLNDYSVDIEKYLQDILYTEKGSE